jgi:DNA-binding NtrC family response regulator
VGTGFFVDLPEQVRVEHRWVGGVAERSPGRARVLVCEDNQDVALLLRTLLEHGGFAVDVVYSVREARAALARQEYAVMTLDLMLPDAAVSFSDLAQREKAHHPRSCDRVDKSGTGKKESVAPRAEH